MVLKLQYHHPFLGTSTMLLKLELELICSFRLSFQAAFMQSETVFIILAVEQTATLGLELIWSLNV